jgi:large subunit ribosomal protein L10
LPLKRNRKEEIIAEYVELLQKSQGLIVTEYRGMSMARFDTLRGKMREAGANYNVTKNTLFKIALKEVGMAVPEDLLSGPVAVGFAFKDLPSTVKVLIDSTKDNELLILKGAIAQTTVFPENKLKTLSELPSLDQLRASLIGMLTQPMSTLVSLLVQPQRDLVNVVAAYVDKQGGSEAA